MQKLLKTYKYKLKLSNSQQHKVDSWTGACRYVYNLAMETKIHAYKTYGLSISCFDLLNQLPDLKQEADWIKDIPAQTLQDAVERMDRAYKSFFRGNGYPKWAKKGVYNSITLKSVKQKDNCFFLPKLGNVRYFNSRTIPKNAKLKIATITHELDGYYICVVFESTIPSFPYDQNQAVGIDWGVTHFLSSSDGQHIANPKYTKQFESQLRIEQRSLARKVKFSANWYKQKRRISKLQRKIGRVRKDFLQKQSSLLVASYDYIAAEKLKVKNMTASAKGTAEKHGKMVRQKAGLNKSILDAAPGMFFSMLDYKCQWQGKKFVQVDPKNTSRKCRVCGHTELENRKKEVFFCISCGHKDHADVNAAKNILARAKASVRQREALACA